MNLSIRQGLEADGDRARSEQRFTLDLAIVSSFNSSNRLLKS